MAKTEEAAEERRRDAWAATVKETLQAALDAKGLSHRAFAKMIGKSGGAVSIRLTSGALNEWWTLYRIAEVLGLSTDVILGFKPVPFDASAPGPRAAARAERRLAQARELVGLAERDIAGKKKP